MYWDGTDAHISIASSTLNIDGSGETLAKFIDDGAVELYHNNTKTFETRADGVTVTGRAVSATISEEDDGSFNLATSNHFECVPAGDLSLTFTNQVVGQSGNIFFDNSGGHNISAAAEVGINAAALTALDTAGVYSLAYFVKAASGNASVLVSVSGALTSQGA
jgi:hypothetical protein